MATVKKRLTEVIQSQPDDASYEEIMRELAFERMIERGLEDSRTCNSKSWPRIFQFTRQLRRIRWYDH